MRAVSFAVAIAACTMVPQASMAAQPTGLPPVPSGLSAEQTSALSKSRDRVVAEGKKLQVVVEDHHKKCAHAYLPPPNGQTADPNAVALEQRCDAEQAEIDRQVKQYSADANAYRNAVHATVAAGAHAGNAYSARVSLKGGVHLTRSGVQETLTSSTVIKLTSGDRITTAPHARAAFQLPDKSQFIMGAQSDITLVTMVNDKTPAKRRISISLAKGVLHWVSGEVPSALAEHVTIQLGGGEVRVGVCDLQVGNAAGGGYVALFKGDAQVVEHAKNGATFVLRPNEITTYAQGADFAAARKLQPNEIRTP